MTSVSTVSPTGNAYVDGVLFGTKWAVDSLTYSFPGSPAFYGAGYASGEPGNHFKAFTAAQQAAVQRVLAMDSAVANVTFTKITESATTHATIRYAESDKPNTGWGYYPGTNAAGGDVWLNNSTHWYDWPVKGNYAWTTIIHETGHAMGLKHPQDVSGAFGAMPANHDSLEYSVMSYRSYVGAPLTGGYTNAATSYPQTLMMYDIAALQAMYGANYNTQGGDTVYSWNPSTGQEFVNGVGQGAPAGNKIFMTLWDGGGNDTYDFSNYATNLKVDLAPGAWTTVSAGQLAALGNGHSAAGNIANAILYHGSAASLIENAVGGAGNDVIFGNAANNRLTGGRGNDVIDGRGGTDTAVYSGNAANYSWSANADGSWTIVDHRSGSPDGTDTLRNIEVLQFADGQVALPPTTTTAAVNHAPVAHNDGYAVAKNVRLAVAKAHGVLVNDHDPDGDALHAVRLTNPGAGSLVVHADGSFVYTPAKNFVGTVAFRYVASDGPSHSNIAKVTINVGLPHAAAAAAAAPGGGFANIMDDQAPAPAYHGAGWVDPFHADSLAGLDWPVPFHDAGLSDPGWSDPLGGHAAAGLLFY
jgi:serralysin